MKYEYSPPPASGADLVDPVLLGCSRWAHRIRDEISRLNGYDASVLITGPSGTGKELIARNIHRQSARVSGPFIPVDCTSITGALFASQLFGHRKGAFTGADHETLGCFRAANGGTIFLDEIGELDIDLQSKLLRVLEERVVVPVGGHDSVSIDVRVVAATNRDLKRDVVERRFREDLYFRLNVVTLETVGLRDRPEDIYPLLEHFLDRLAERTGFPRKQHSPGALELLASFDWPGNVRQLQHMLEQAVISCDGDLITLPLIQRLIEKSRFPKPHRSVRRERTNQSMRLQHKSASDHRFRHAPELFHLPMVSRPDPASPDPPLAWDTLDDMDRKYIRAAVEHTYYNQTAAAALLGISRHTLIRKMKRYGILMPTRSRSSRQPR